MLLFVSNLGKDLISSPDLDDLPAPHQCEPVPTKFGMEILMNVLIELLHI